VTLTASTGSATAGAAGMGGFTTNGPFGPEPINCLLHSSYFGSSPNRGTTLLSAEREPAWGLISSSLFGFREAGVGDSAPWDSAGKTPTRIRARANRRTRLSICGIRVGSAITVRVAVAIITFLPTGPAPPVPPWLWQATQEVSL